MPPGFTRNIMLTGYWPPTNEMLRRFSANPEQNPDGWIGENWEGSGFDVHAFFPEFDEYPRDKIGSGDFRVLYQDTSKDFWRITSKIRPCAIITFSQTFHLNWEIEAVETNYFSWKNDLSYQFPDPSPPDASIPCDAQRHSTLPMEEIRSAVEAADLSVPAIIDTRGSGDFLSGYIAYHGVWYRAMHYSPESSRQCVAAGHIHVADIMPLEEAIQATEITLRALITYVRNRLPPFRTVPDVRELRLPAAGQLLQQAGCSPKISGPSDADAWVRRQNPSPETVIQAPFKVLLQTRTGEIP